MKIYCDWADTKESNNVSKTLHEASIGWKNIKNEYMDLIWFRVVLVPKSKQEKILTLFPEIKEGSPSEWLKGLGITHYWKEL